MAENSNIAWTTHTFNPWRGCTKVAEGCANCYAEAFSHRNPATLGKWGNSGTRVLASERQWRQPLTWNRWAKDGVCWVCGGKGLVRNKSYDWEPCLNCDPEGRVAPYRARVFCASLADVFENYAGVMVNSQGGDQLIAVDPQDEQPDSWYRMDHARQRLFNLIDATPHLDWLLLTKRPENIPQMLPLPANGRDAGDPLYMCRENLWLGTSIANQADADRNLPALMQRRDFARILFVSAEPLIGPVDLSRWLPSSDGFIASADGSPIHVSDGGEALDWVIAGGESGPRARPCELAWLQSLVDQCRHADTACFVKQLGARPTSDGQLRDMPKVAGKGDDPEFWPPALRVQEIPLASNTTEGRT